MLLDEYQAIYNIIYEQHQLQLYNKQKIDKWFTKHFVNC